MNSWIALYNEKIEEIIGLTVSIKKKIFIGFVNNVKRNLIALKSQKYESNYFDNSSVNCDKNEENCIWNKE